MSDAEYYGVILAELDTKIDELRNELIRANLLRQELTKKISEDASLRPRS